MHSYKKDNNNTDRNSNNNKFLSRAFNLKLATCKRAIIIRYKY